MNSFLTVGKESVAEFRDRGSKFLAYAFPVQSADECKKRLKELKEEHSKAAHHCFAYRIGTEGVNFRSSDDGEPSGSAGKPILGQIDSKGLTNTAIVVVRYFGGTLLGVPGLINAYKTSASLALQLTTIVERPVLELYELEFDYTLMNEVMMVLKRHRCEVIEQELHLFCRMVAGFPKANETTCLEQLHDLHTLEVHKYREVV
jgi:uncharacterized YigZ family protein